MRENKLFKGIKIFFISIFALAFFMAFFIDDTSEEAKADGFTIDSYKVILDVKEDNKVDVTEEITVNWLNTNHHGIYKFTPQWLEYTGKDGKTIKRKSIVKLYSEDSEVRVSVQVPDLIGKTATEAEAILKESGLNLKTTGSGYVANQDPPAGTQVEKGTIVRVELKARSNELH